MREMHEIHEMEAPKKHLFSLFFLKCVFLLSCHLTYACYEKIQRIIEIIFLKETTHPC